MSVISITVDGNEIADSVIFSTATFESQLGAIPGMFEFTVRDDQQVHHFDTGAEVVMSIDGTRYFGGYVMQVVHTLAFPVDDTTGNVGEVKTRQFVLRGVDYNILFDKRVVYNVASPTSGIPLFSSSTTDLQVLQGLFADYMDTPAGLDTTTFVDAVGDPTPSGAQGAYVNPGDSWRKQMEDLAQFTGAIWYIDADFKLHYQAIEDVSVSWSFADKPNNTTTYGFRELEYIDDATNVVNDALVWGGSPFGSTGVTAQTVFGREQNTTSQATVGRWQYVEKHFGEIGFFEEEGCEARARVIVRGDPAVGTTGTGSDGVVRGLQNPQQNVRLTWFTDTVPTPLTCGSAVNVFLYVYGPPPVQLTLPVRSIRITFPTPSEARFEGFLGIQTNDPWSLWKYLKKVTRTAPQVGQTLITSDGTNPHAVPGTQVCTTPTPAVDGSTVIFAVPYGYVAGSMQVYLNGLIQRPGVSFEYVETSPSAGTFTMSSAPLVGDQLWVCYTSSGV